MVLTLEQFNFFWVIQVPIEEIFPLVIGDLLPIPSSHDIFSHLWQLLDNKRVLLSDIVVSHHGHFLKGSEHASKHGQLVKEVLIQILPEPQEIRFSEGGDLILPISLLTGEKTVNSQPDLSLDLGDFVLLFLWDDLPFLVLELLSITLDVFPDPRFHLKERDQYARNIVGLHELMDDSHG